MILSHSSSAPIPVQLSLLLVVALLWAVFRWRGAQARLEEAERLYAACQAELVRSQRLASVGRLATGLAHELNTPIQFVGDNTRFLQTSFEALAEADEEERAYLAEEIPTSIQQSLDGLGRVTEVLRSFKAYAHPGASSKVAADVHEMLRDTVVLARNEWRYVAHLELDFQEGLAAVPCYTADLNQVLLNLVVNAAHAVQDQVGGEPEAKGTIRIRTLQKPAEVEIHISDSGVGMSPEVMSKIFVPFFTTKSVGRGTGQGLAIAREIIEKKHGGRLSCQSEPGRGTTFVVALPTEAVG